MKKRVAGGAIIGALVLGMYLANLWNGPGLGGKGADSGTAAEPVDTTPVSTSVQPPSRPVDPVPPSEQSHITVVLHGNQYRLSNDDSPFEGMDVALQTVVDRARKMAGDENGVKVYIMLERSAQEGTRSDLRAALTEGGVKEEEILELSGFVD